MIEFEVKAPVPSGHEAFVRQRLGAPERVEEHVDTYYHHPCRDVEQTDEAIRLSLRGDLVELTYKGSKLDARTKSRREVTVRVDEEPRARALLLALGFSPAAEVRKRREVFHAEGFEVALDTVPGLGVFVELERMLGDDEARDEAETRADEVLRGWGLDERERRSYLEMVKEKGLSPPASP